MKIEEDWWIIGGDLENLSVLHPLLHPSYVFSGARDTLAIELKSFQPSWARLLRALQTFLSPFFICFFINSKSRGFLMHNQIMVLGAFFSVFLCVFSLLFKLSWALSSQPRSLMLIQASAEPRQTFVASKLRKCTFSSSYLAALLPRFNCFKSLRWIVFCDEEVAAEKLTTE